MERLSSSLAVKKKTASVWFGSVLSFCLKFKQINHTMAGGGEAVAGRSLRVPLKTAFCFYGLRLNLYVQKCFTVNFFNRSSKG